MGNPETFSEVTPSRFFQFFTLFLKKSFFCIFFFTPEYSSRFGVLFLTQKSTLKKIEFSRYMINYRPQVLLSHHQIFSGKTLHSLKSKKYICLVIEWFFKSNFNPPMPDSKSAQSWYFFVILESNNFLGFQNIYPELHDPSWFWQLFLFCLNSLLFVCLITRDRICKKVMQNEMIMFLHNYMSLRDFKSFLC